MSECGTIRIVKLEPEVLQETWRQFKADGDLELRNALVLHYSSTVRYVAGKIGATLPAMVDRDDLVSYGMLGLMDAIEKFDIDRCSVCNGPRDGVHVDHGFKGLQFQTYGVSRITGEIYDQIRALDWVPRSVRAKGRDLDKARVGIEKQLGRPASSGEVAAEMGLTLAEYHAMSSQASVPHVGTYAGAFASGADEDEHEQDSIFDPMMNPEALVETKEIIELMGEAVNTMDERSKTILVLYYLQDMTLAEIGKILGVTESRVCQLQSKMLLALRESLGPGALAGLPS